jgi:hypothetical protein
MQTLMDYQVAPSAHLFYNAAEACGVLSTAQAKKALKDNVELQKAIQLLAAAKTFHVFEDQAIDYVMTTLDNQGIAKGDAKKIVRLILENIP